MTSRTRAHAASAVLVTAFFGAVLLLHVLVAIAPLAAAIVGVMVGALLTAASIRMDRR